MDTKPVQQQQQRPTPTQLLQTDIFDAVMALNTGTLTGQGLATYMQMAFVRGTQDVVRTIKAKEDAAKPAPSPDLHPDLHPEGAEKSN